LLILLLAVVVNNYLACNPFQHKQPVLAIGSRLYLSPG
jgi:hypothetical protein